MLWYCLIGFLFVSFVGSALHFLYDWLSHNKFASIFVAVNESTWEHLKLAMLPTFLWAIIGAIFFDFNNFAFGVLVTLVAICTIIPVIFYTYTHFTKKPILTVDISSFFVAIAIGMTLAYIIFSSAQLGNVCNIIGTVGTILITLGFVAFTFFTPKCPFFKDPITNKYGRAGHHDDKNFGNDFPIKKKK